mgnify:FL=1
MPVTDGVLTLAADIHARFRALPGSGQIASEFALTGALAWLRRSRPMRVLEIGAGIGCLSEVIRRWAVSDSGVFLNAEIICVEDEPWCQAQWQQNVRPLPPGLHLFDKAPLLVWWDFVLLDGPQMPADGWIALAQRGVIFVEGGRRAQRSELHRVLREAGRHSIEATWRPPDRSKGFSVVLCDPTPAEEVWFAAVRCHEWLRDLPLRLRGRPVGKRRAEEMPP